MWIAGSAISDIGVWDDALASMRTRLTRSHRASGMFGGGGARHHRPGGRAEHRYARATLVTRARSSPLVLGDASTLRNYAYYRTLRDAAQRCDAHPSAWAHDDPPDME